jgi:hypothetical protein
VLLSREKKEVVMESFSRTVVTARLYHSKLPRLLEEKGFYNEYGWNRFLRRSNQLAPNMFRKIEVVFFRPEEQEFNFGENIDRKAFTRRKLFPGSLFEVLAAIPDRKDYKERAEICKQLGDEFFIFAHAHYVDTWFRRQYFYVSGKYGSFDQVSFGVMTSRSVSWYVGYRPVPNTKPSA